MVGAGAAWRHVQRGEAPVPVPVVPAVLAGFSKISVVEGAARRSASSASGNQRAARRAARLSHLASHHGAVAGGGCGL